MGALKIKNPETGVWEYVGTPIEAVGMQMDLLWTNPNPTAEFPAQTVELDLSGYDFIAVHFENGIGCVLKNYVGAVGKASNFYAWGTGANYEIVGRRFDIVENGISFRVGYSTGGAGGTNASEMTASLRPWYIYGLRNTSSSNSTGDGTTESIEYPGCFYRMVNGVQEWLNPPMELGVEYKTTERYLGKPVYVVAFDCGNLPNATYKFAAVPNSTSVERVIRASATTSDRRTLPGASGAEQNEEILFFANGAQAQFITRKDQSALTATATVWYTKTTD